jgi:hypothetical protein
MAGLEVLIKIPCHVSQGKRTPQISTFQMKQVSILKNGMDGGKLPDKFLTQHCYYPEITKLQQYPLRICTLCQKNLER